MSDTQIEITPQELKTLPQDSYQLIDTRDDASIAYGMANGAIHIPQEGVVDRLTSEPELLKGRTAILYCARGILSMELASELNRRGIPSRSLTGGYNGWLLAHLAGDTPDKSEAEKEEARLARQKRIEDSIRRKFHVPLFSRFAKAVRDYELIQENDKIAVCISGGKDSMLMAKLLQLLQRHSDVPFEVIDLVMDPGYNAVNRQKIESNAALLHIPVTIFETNIFDVTSGIEQSPCYLCARMRRGYLYSKARELGCNKIALGHHFSDVVETTVMGMFYGSQLQAMPPKLRSRNFPGMELIRPMYCIHEDDIIAWQRYNGLEFIQCACRFTERAAAHGNDGSSSKRQEVKLLLRELRRTNPDIEKSIFHSIHSVCLDTMVGYKSGGVEHTFADCYRERGEMAELAKEDAE